MSEKITLDIIKQDIQKFCDDNLIFIPVGKSALDIVREPDRRQEYVQIRRFIVKKLKDELKWSFPRIGRFLNKDHTTAIHLYYK